MDNVEEQACGLFTVAIVVAVVTFLVKTGRGSQAMKLGEECLIFLGTNARLKEDHFTWLYLALNELMFKVACQVPDYTSAERYAKELLRSHHASGYTIREGELSFELGLIYQSQNEFEEAIQYYQKASDITKSTGDKKTEALCYKRIGFLFQSLCKYHQDKKYYRKAQALTVLIGDRFSEAITYGNLGSVFQSLGEYDRAEEYYKKALEIRKEISDVHGVASDYRNLGTLFHSLCKYKKAQR